MFWPRRCSIFNTTDYVPGRCFCLLSDAHQTNAQRQVHRIKLKSPGFNNMRPSAFFCGGRFSGSPPAMLPFSVSNNPPPPLKKKPKNWGTRFVCESPRVKQKVMQWKNDDAEQMKKDVLHAAAQSWHNTDVPLTAQQVAFTIHFIIEVILYYSEFWRWLVLHPLVNKTQLRAVVASL